MQLVDFWLPSTVGSLNFHHPLTGTSGPVGVSAKWLGMPNLIGADFSQWVELTAENCVFFPSNWKMTFHKHEPIHYTMFFFKSRNIWINNKYGKTTFLNKKSFCQEPPKANNQQQKTTNGVKKKDGVRVEVFRSWSPFNFTAAATWRSAAPRRGERFWRDGKLGGEVGGIPKWMVYNGKPYKNGWFRGENPLFLQGLMRV